MLGNKIRASRKNANMTQEDLAKEIGVQRSVISKYESGVINPTVAQLQKIAAALNIPLMDLMDLSPAEREQLERDALSQEATNRLMDALDASDGAMIEAFKDIPDANIKAHLTAIVDDELTREGQILTLKRAYELSMQQKYNRWPTERKTPQA